MYEETESGILVPVDDETEEIQYEGYRTIGIKWPPWMCDKTHLTARKRTALSRPALWLFQNSLLYGPVLDFGCGRGDDAGFLEELGIATEKYDPYYFRYPEVLDQKYSVVLCTYVLNVLPSGNRKEVLDQLRAIDAKHVYITVRRDLEEDHVAHERGTAQFMVYLEEDDITKIYENARFCIYHMERT